MLLTLDLPPELEYKLQLQADSQQIPLNKLVEKVLTQTFNSEWVDLARQLGQHTTMLEAIQKALEFYSNYLQQQPMSPLKLSETWSTGFFEQTAGAWQGEPLIRPTQDDYETRAELL